MSLEKRSIDNTLVYTVDQGQLNDFLASEMGTIVVGSDMVLTEDALFPNTLSLLFINGAKIVHGSFTVSMRSAFLNLPPYPIFEGNGEVSLYAEATPKIHSVWFEEAADTDSVNGFNKALVANKDNIPVILPNGAVFNSTPTLPATVPFIEMGSASLPNPSESFSGGQLFGGTLSNGAIRMSSEGAIEVGFYNLTGDTLSLGQLCRIAADGETGLIALAELGCPGKVFPVASASIPHTGYGFFTLVGKASVLCNDNGVVKGKPIRCSLESDIVGVVAGTAQCITGEEWDIWSVRLIY